MTTQAAPAPATETQLIERSKKPAKVAALLGGSKR